MVRGGKAASQPFSAGKRQPLPGKGNKVDKNKSI